MGLATLCYAGIGLAMLRYCVATRALSLLLAAGALSKTEKYIAGNDFFFIYHLPNKFGSRGQILK